MRLPPGEDLNEWLAVNTVDFYNAASVLHGTLAEFCTERSCEVMCAGSKVFGVFLWCVVFCFVLFFLPGPSPSNHHHFPPCCSTQIIITITKQTNKKQQYEYLWADGVKVRKPLRLSAPAYVEALFDWVEAQIDDEAVFPAQFGEPFPPAFRDAVGLICRRLFRVYAHIYHAHFKQVRAVVFVVVGWWWWCCWGRGCGVLCGVVCGVVCFA